MKILLYILLFISLIMFWGVEKLTCPKCGKIRIVASNSKTIICEYCGHTEQL